jgi:hypothetical protein
MLSARALRSISKESCHSIVGDAPRTQALIKLMASPPRRTRRSSFGATECIFEDKENAQPAKNERRRSVLKVF